jgi:threonine dehydratase
MAAISEIQAARQRIAPYVRRTPSVGAAPALLPAELSGRLTLKLESLQVTGSFKARGAANKVLSLAPERVARGLVTASGGNHGLGVAHAGRIAGAPVMIYLPASAPPTKAEALERLGAQVLREGEVWDDANRAALEAASRDGLTYVHPFADPAVIAGQGTLGLEILEDAPETDLVVAAIGGGGLIAGVASALKALRPGLRVVGVEPAGAPTLFESLRAGRVVELPAITTAAHSLAPRRSDELNFGIIRQTVEEIVLVTDDEMRDAARWLWREMGVAAELSAAAALAALLTGKVSPGPSLSTCALVCGAGTDGMV